MKEAIYNIERYLTDNSLDYIINQYNECVSLIHYIDLYIDKKLKFKEPLFIDGIGDIIGLRQYISDVMYVFKDSNGDYSFRYLPMNKEILTKVLEHVQKESHE